MLVEYSLCRKPFSDSDWGHNATEFYFSGPQHREGCTAERKASTIKIPHVDLTGLSVKTLLAAFSIPSVETTKEPLPVLGTACSGDENGGEVLNRGFENVKTKPKNAWELYFPFHESDLDNQIGEEKHPVRKLVVDQRTIVETREKGLDGLKVLMVMWEDRHSNNG